MAPAVGLDHPPAFSELGVVSAISALGIVIVVFSLVAGEYTEPFGTVSSSKLSLVQLADSTLVAVCIGTDAYSLT